MNEDHYLAIPRTASALLALSILAAGVGSAAENATRKLTGPYFGQPPPGFEAELFAPDLISQKGRYEFAISFAPGGQRLLFTVQSASGKVQVLHSRLTDGFWTRPEPVNLGNGVNSEFSESCPSLSDDGKYLFFSRYDEPDEVAQIYWVDSGVIENARQRQLIE